MGRDNPLFTNGVLQQTDTKVAHLFEIELARLKVMENAVASDTVIKVNNIDKCLTDMILYYSREISAGNFVVETVTVTNVNIQSSSVTISTGLLSDLDKGSYLVEGLYPDDENISSSVALDNLALYSGAFGGMTGRILLTDYDVPIIAPIKRLVYKNQVSSQAVDGFGLYIPYPLGYNSNSIASSGKKNQVSITMANVDQLIGSLILTHQAFKDRKIIIKTAYLNNSIEYSMLKSYEDIVHVGLGDNELNSPFSSYMPVILNDMITEFEGNVDSCSITPEAVNIVAYSGIDNRKLTLIPRRTYTALRCQFIYKGSQCRFISELVLAQNINDTQIGDITVSTLGLKGYFSLLNDGETATILIDNEEIEIDGISIPVGTSKVNYFIGKLGQQETQDIYDSITQPSLAYYQLHIKTRGHNDTTASAHTDNTAIDIPRCNKSLHDCELRFNTYNYGAFPGVPKTKSYR